MNKQIIRYGSSAVFLLVGILFNIFNIGNNFDIMGSVGNWLIYIGCVSILINLIRIIKKPQKKHDERSYYIATKANRIVFLIVFAFAFLVMVIDGIKTITISYHMFMSYFICGLVVTYFLVYKIIEKDN